MSDANLTSRQDGSYNSGDQLTLVCSKRGQEVTGFFNSNVPGRGNDLWYQTSDGHYVADVDIDTSALKVAAPECSSAMPGVDGKAAPVAEAGRAAGRTQGVNPGTEGQCTWGAAQKWFEASGSYPALSGDAMSWSDAAAAAGWTVVDDLGIVRSSYSNPASPARAASAMSRGWIRSPNAPMVDGYT